MAPRSLEHSSVSSIEGSVPIAVQRGKLTDDEGGCARGAHRMVE